MEITKITQIGNSLGVILPKEIVEFLGAAKGSKLSIRRTPNGIELAPYDEEYEEDMRIARDIMDRYRNALRELAK